LQPATDVQQQRLLSEAEALQRVQKQAQHKMADKLFNHSSSSILYHDKSNSNVSAFAQRTCIQQMHHDRITLLVPAAMLAC
jgi:hypothetical protein